MRVPVSGTTAAPARLLVAGAAAGVAALVAGAVVVGAVVGVVAVAEPAQWYPPCPVARLTGLLCPGCGGLRGAHALARGDLAAAFGANALLVTGLALLAVTLGARVARAVAGLPARPRPRGRVAVVTALVVAAVFTLVRNLPVGAALAP